jgi:membrane protease YdiL (CAAX protease family)
MNPPGVEVIMAFIWQIIIALLLGLSVLAIAAAVIMSIPNSPQLFEKYPWLMGFIPHTSMLLISTLILLIVGKGKLGQFGYKLPGSFNIPQVIILPLVIGVIANVILNFMPGKDSFMPKGFSFGHIVVFIWLYASICEEIYTRGLIQGYLRPLTNRAVLIAGIRLSLPVIVGAVYFSLIHLMAFGKVGNPLTLAIFLIAAFILGLLAGYQLEKTGSLIPAIIVHMSFNISGTLVDRVARIVS